ncbi:MAG: cytochrome c [Gammaproteobacteria bacterium]|nr:cytochrome c [Gammaproteobacteria bacterium]MDH5240979.1 cytochrome c [Gammaproteobacteria bacterium]MDH5308818.1 cytochrome c [Gammaproteobacteria bacterium]MDH5501829.1 cytochrome c [Gammaproteobacteria bacterium]
MISRYLLCALGLYATATVAVAQQESATSLKTIMQGLRNDTVSIMDAMLVDDFTAVAEAAVRISDHPRIPPEQVSLVAAELDSEMAAFKQFDTLVHDLSMSLREAAEEGDRFRVQKTFQDMIAGCLGCHLAYRQRVISALAEGN